MPFKRTSTKNIRHKALNKDGFEEISEDLSREDKDFLKEILSKSLKCLNVTLVRGERSANL